MRESDIRTAIAARESPHAAEGPSLIVPELVLCQAEARIDVAVIDSLRLTGWEIKTKTDRLDRLTRQEAVYSRVFDRMWLAADEKHIAHALSVIPEWWGVMRVDDRDGVCHLAKVRSSRLNRAVDLHALVRLLWRDEVLAELDDLGLGVGVAKLPRRELWQRLAEASPQHISPTQLRRHVRLRLMARRDWRVDPPQN